MKKVILISLIGIIGLASCKKEGCTDETAQNYSESAQKDDGSCTYAATPTEPSSTHPVLIGTATTSQNETVSLYADAALSSGYSRMYVKVTDASGTAMTNSTITFAPLMDMGAMVHTTPVENPVYNASTERYEGVVVFIMSSMAGTWTMDVVVDGNPASFNLTVAESPTKVVGSYLGDDGNTYFVSVERPENWVVGMNDLEILIHRRDNMMSFPADDDFDIVFVPEMVSMGHSSTGNISPVNVGNGHYNGDVNLSMAGDWRFHLELWKNGTLVHTDAFLDILF
jgi:hypothetical protein